MGKARVGGKGGRGCSVHVPYHFRLFLFAPKNFFFRATKNFFSGRPRIFFSGRPRIFFPGDQEFFFRAKFFPGGREFVSTDPIFLFHRLPPQTLFQATSQVELSRLVGCRRQRAWSSSTIFVQSLRASIALGLGPRRKRGHTQRCQELRDVWAWGHG